MEFLNPVALYGFLALPLLLVPYLIRRKPRRVPFSSLLLFRESGARPSANPWGRLRLPPLFFLQLLLLILLILALAEPVFTTAPTHVAIIMDNSASMQAREGSASRFSLAQEKARSIVSEIGSNGQIDLYLTTPRLQRVGSASLAPRQAVELISGLLPYDLGDPAEDYKTLLPRLARENKYERVFLLTDHPSRGQTETIRVVTVGSTQANLALTSFSVRRSALANATNEASFTVSNFSSKDERVRIVVRASGNAVANREFLVGAGKSAAATLEGVPAHSFYEAEIQTRDALDLDNRSFAVAPGSAALRILAISPRPQEVMSLRALPGVTLTVIPPGDYQQIDRGGYDLEIFHFAAPSVLPRTPALLILPPGNNPLVDLNPAVSAPVVSAWREPHVLTRYVNFALFRPAYARPLKPKTPATAVIESANGPLAIAIERPDSRQLVLGFNPFPYLGRGNLPMSIFTLNFIDWFSREGGGKEKATGEPLAIDAAAGATTVVTPKQKRLSVVNASFNETYYQGLYEISRAAEKRLVAINFVDPNESDLRAPAPIDVAGADGAASRLPALAAYWPYLLLAAVALLLIEWFATPRRVARIPG